MAATAKIANLEQLWQTDKCEKHERVITVRTTKIVEPPTYQTDMQRLKKLEADYAKLLAIVQYGNISTVSTLVEAYKASSKKYLINLTRELQFYLASAEERQQLIDFISYLEHVQNELKKFLLDDKEGG